MYQSPIDIIKQIQEDINAKIEDGVYRAVQKVGINVDKDELLKALAYDRGQYAQGYADGLKEQPEQKHGHWVFLKIRGMYWCSECNTNKAYRSAYCPDCGAKMDGEEL